MRARASTGAAVLLALLLPASAAATLHGIDVSRWQRRIAWPSVARDGYKFAFVKATEGRRGSDWAYVIFRNGASAAGLRVGAYHMARPDGATAAAAKADAVAEADHFVATADVADADLPPVLDLEHTGGLPPRRLIRWTSAWLAEVRREVGVRAAIYVSPAFWRRALADTAWFAERGHPLWIARWTNAPWPTVPARNWGESGWTFWQWTDCGHVPGIRGCVDRDRFNGSALGPVLVPPAPALVTPPAIGGDPVVGRPVAAVAGAWQATPSPAFTFAWARCDETGAICTAIAGADEASYTPTASDVGYSLVVSVTAISRGRSATARSRPTPLVR